MHRGHQNAKNQNAQKKKKDCSSPSVRNAQCFYNPLMGMEFGSGSGGAVHAFQWRVDDYHSTCPGLVRVLQRK